MKKPIPELSLETMVRIMKSFEDIEDRIYRPSIQNNSSKNKRKN